MRRRFNERLGDAQDKQDTAFSFGSFSFTGKKMNKYGNRAIHRIGSTYPDPPLEVEGLDYHKDRDPQAISDLDLQWR